MKKKRVVFSVSLGVFMLLWMALGVGYRPSGAALNDLNEQLVSLYGEEYGLKQIGHWKEDMKFYINPKTFFLSNWSFRHFFSLPYEYECKVVFENYNDEGYYKSRTITYQAFDPMGYENENKGAYIVLDSMKEVESDLILLTK